MNGGKWMHVFFIVLYALVVRMDIRIIFQPDAPVGLSLLFCVIASATITWAVVRHVVPLLRSIGGE